MQFSLKKKIFAALKAMSTGNSWHRRTVSNTAQGRNDKTVAEIFVRRYIGGGVIKL